MDLWHSTPNYSNYTFVMSVQKNRRGEETDYFVIVMFLMKAAQKGFSHAMSTLLKQQNAFRYNLQVTQSPAHNHCSYTLKKGGKLTKNTPESREHE